MDRGTEQTPIETAGAVAPPSQEKAGRAAEIDLDRLVWDPEYRNAMRPLIKHAC